MSTVMSDWMEGLTWGDVERAGMGEPSTQWRYENKEIPVYVVREDHDYIYYGKMHHCYNRVTGAEFYGILRSRCVLDVHLSASDPIHIALSVLVEDIECQEWYSVKPDEYFHFLEYYLRSYGTHEPEMLDWREVGF